MQNRRYSRRLVSLSTNSPGTGCVAAPRPIAPDAQLEATDDKPTAPGHYAAPPRRPPPPWTPQPPGIPPLFGTPRGAGALLGGSCAPVRPSVALRATCPDPLRGGSFCAGGNTSTPHLGGYAHIGKHGWRKQQMRTNQTCQASPPNPRGRNCHSLCNINRKANARCSEEVHLLPVNSTTTPPTSTTTATLQQQHPTATPRYARARWVPSCPQCAKSSLASRAGLCPPTAPQTRARADLILALRFAALSGGFCPRRMRGLSGCSYALRQSR